MSQRIGRKKRPHRAVCRECGCTDERSCNIVTKRGTRQCEWLEAGLCDNPQCLVRTAQRLEKPQPDPSEAFRLREKAANIREHG